MRRDQVTPRSSSPLIVRLAGLPSHTLSDFSSEPCSHENRIIQSLLAEIASARSAFCDRLYEVVSNVPATSRRALLSARRDVFNGRPLVLYRETPFWAELCARTGQLAETVAGLEDRLTAARLRLADIHASEGKRERQALLRLLENQGFSRGLALASPDTAEHLHRVQQAPDRLASQKETRLATTLLRYVTRAAFKLSPYSTLTRLGIASSEPSSGRLCLSDVSEERSLLRLKRYILDQLWDLLRRYPPFRAGLRVGLNETIEQVEPHRYRFLRPGFGALNPSSQKLAYNPASLVKVTLDGPVVDWLLSELPARSISYGELHSLLAVSKGDHHGEILEKLTDLGFLCLVPPWPAHAARLEGEILAYLRTLTPDPAVDSLIRVLDRIIELQISFPEVDTPVRSVREIEALIEEMWNVSAPLGGLHPDSLRRRQRIGNIYEDVFLLGASSGRETVLIPEETILKIRRSFAPLERFLGLYSPHPDFLLTVAAFVAERWKGRREVGFLEFLGAIQPLWRSYVKFLQTHRRAGEQAATFNPLGLTELEQLGHLRKEIWSEMAHCFEPSPAGFLLRSEVLAELVERIPEIYAPTVGSCLFIQPADAEGSAWVVNRLYEGTGRYSSRFTAVMNSERAAYTAHLTACGWDTKGAELLDITSSKGDTLNVHEIQTHRRLEWPGEPLFLPPAHRVSLRELSIRVNGPGVLPDLIDREGCPCRPVHLGGVDFDYMSTPLKVLAAFGPGEMRLRLPPRPEQVEDGVTKVGRLLLDDVILARKRWLVTPSPFFGKLDRVTEAEAFELINQWRQDRGLPDRVVFIEHVYHALRDDLYKPQYLDFTSPSLVALFCLALRQNTGSLTFEEMVPTPDAAPRNLQGHPWAMELQLDSLVLRKFDSVAAYRNDCQDPAPNLGVGVAQREPVTAH